MELKEAIEHAEHKAADVSCCCRADHKQLAQWLKELAERRDKEKNLNLGEGTMELKDTIEMMTSADYKERFKAEYLQTKIRANKLHKAIDSGVFVSALNVIAQAQLNHMINYMSILAYRAYIQGIDLED